jgi:hypothetical protein
MAKAQYVREIQKNKDAPAKPHWRVAGMTAVMPSNSSPEAPTSSSSDTRAPVSPETISGTTGSLIDLNWVMSTESLEPFLDNLNRADLPDPGLEYAYPMYADYNMVNFDGSPIGVAFGMTGFIP